MITKSSSSEDLLYHIKEKYASSESMMEPIDLNMTFVLIRKIMKPDFRWQLIPQSLSLLAQIERVRQYCEAEAERLLSTSTRRFNSGDDSLASASQPERSWRKGLQRICRPQAKNAMRELFQMSILGLCETHINRLWTSQESYLLPKYMRIYFPSLYIAADRRFEDDIWKNHYLHESTIKEREDVHKEGLHCKAFLERAREWDSDWRAARAVNDSVKYEKAFFSEFTSSVKAHLENIEKFVDKVEGYSKAMVEHTQS